MTTQSTEAQTCGPMATLTDEHKRLEPFVGVFKAEVKMYMDPSNPHVSTGVMRNDLDLGGLFLRQTYKGDASDGPFPNFEGRGFWGYNTAIRKYEGVWIDNASTIMQCEQGDVDKAGKVWTMAGQVPNPETGQPMGKRSVITLIDKNHHTMDMYFTTPDGGEFKAMEIKYERTS